MLVTAVCVNATMSRYVLQSMMGQKILLDRHKYYH